MNKDIIRRGYRHPLLRMVLTVFAIFTLYSVVLTTLYVKMETDVAFMVPVLIDIVPYITDLCELIGILIAYTVILFNWRLSGTRERRGYIIAFAALTAYKYAAKIIVTLIMNGALSSVKGYLTDMLLGVILPFALEMVQFAVVILIIRSVMARTQSFIAEKKALEGKLDGYHFDEEALFFPMRSLIDMQNPIQRSAIWIGLVITVSKAGQLLINDIMIGPPEDLTDLLWMALYYIMCIVIGFAAYLGMLLGVMILRGRELKFRFRQ